MTEEEAREIAENITHNNGWTIEQTTASLTIRRNGVIKGTFNA